MRSYKEAVWAGRDPMEIFLAEQLRPEPRIKEETKKNVKLLLDAEDDKCLMMEPGFNFENFIK